MRDKHSQPKWVGCFPCVPGTALRFCSCQWCGFAEGPCESQADILFFFFSFLFLLAPFVFVMTMLKLILIHLPTAVKVYCAEIFVAVSLFFFPPSQFLHLLTSLMQISHLHRSLLSALLAWTSSTFGLLIPLHAAVIRTLEIWRSSSQFVHITFSLVHVFHIYLFRKNNAYFN